MTSCRNRASTEQPSYGIANAEGEIFRVCVGRQHMTSFFFQIPRGWGKLPSLAPPPAGGHGHESTLNLIEVRSHSVILKQNANNASL